MNNEDRMNIEFALAQLRHLYSHMVNGTFNNVESLANGLLSPEISRLERLVRKNRS
jgi:hypothetical protein